MTVVLADLPGETCVSRDARKQCEFYLAFGDELLSRRLEAYTLKFFDQANEPTAKAFVHSADPEGRVWISREVAERGGAALAEVCLHEALHLGQKAVGVPFSEEQADSFARCWRDRARVAGLLTGWDARRVTILPDDCPHPSLDAKVRAMTLKDLDAAVFVTCAPAARGVWTHDSRSTGAAWRERA